MSTKTSIVCILLLLACVGVSKWHHQLDADLYETIIDGDLYVMEALAERIEERDQYIQKLEQYIISHSETPDEPAKGI